MFFVLEPYALNVCVRGNYLTLQMQEHHYRLFRWGHTQSKSVVIGKNQVYFVHVF